MNERMKILEMLQDGKITAEQAAELLAALDTQGEQDAAGKAEGGPFGWRFDRKSLNEWKQISNQIKSSVQQHFDEFRKNIDFDDWSFGRTPRLAVSVTQTLAPGTKHVSLETRNGRIRISEWNEDHVEVHVKSQVKAETLDEARRLLESALTVVQSDEHGQFTVQITREVGGASLDVRVPKGLSSLTLATHNGSVHLDTVELGALTVEAHNGGVTIFRSKAKSMRVNSYNGGIDIQNSLYSTCQSVYAHAHNGKIDIDGIAEGTRISGTVKSHHGRIEVKGDGLVCEFDDAEVRQYGRIKSVDSTSGEAAPTDVFCETHNGAIFIRR